MVIDEIAAVILAFNSFTELNFVAKTLSFTDLFKSRGVISSEQRRHHI